MEFLRVHLKSLFLYCVFFSKPAVQKYSNGGLGDLRNLVKEFGEMQEKHGTRGTRWVFRSDEWFRSLGQQEQQGRSMVGDPQPLWHCILFLWMHNYVYIVRFMFCLTSLIYGSVSFSLLMKSTYATSIMAINGYETWAGLARWSISSSSNTPLTTHIKRKKTFIGFFSWVIIFFFFLLCSLLSSLYFYWDNIMVCNNTVSTISVCSCTPCAV